MSSKGGQCCLSGKINVIVIFPSPLYKMFEKMHYQQSGNSDGKWPYMSDGAGK